MLHLQSSDPPDYPTSDGRPMAETDVHRDQMFDLIYGLKAYFRDRDDVYVSGNLLLYYERGNKHRHVSPDVLVALGRPAGRRDYYLLWEENNHAPDLVFEISSKSTRNEDLDFKMGLYAVLGVREYVIFDPLKEYLIPRLRLFRLDGQQYVPVAGNQLETIPLELRVVEEQLRLFDPAQNALLPTVVGTRSSLEQAVAEREQAVFDRERALDERDQALRRVRELEERLGQPPR